MTRLSNRQLARELKEGNPLGCRHLVEQYQDRLLSEAVHVFHVPRLDAEELVSDVLLAVVDGIEGFAFKRSDADFHFWVMTIFKNRVRDFVRRQALVQGLIERFDEAALESEDQYSEVEQEVVNTIVRDYEKSLREEPIGKEDDESKGGPFANVVDVMEQLEAWERVLLRCRALDTPYEEIARYTGKSVHQLKVYHGRVKKKFVKLLAKYYPQLSQT